MEQIRITSNPYELDSNGIRAKARRIRVTALRMTTRSKLGHVGTDLSEIDILSSLYFSILRYQRGDIDHPDRDYFILSKGHGAGGYYATLCEAGFFPRAYLDTYMEFDSHLPGHPTRAKTPGVEFSTGALGHGLSVAAGIALACKRNGRSNQVFVLTGDGELQEGSNWEAAMAISAFGLTNLYWIIDRNSLQLGGGTESIMPIDPLEDKLRAFGFTVSHMDGNNPAQIVEALSKARQAGDNRPQALIAHTVKGSGVSFMENICAWHHKIPSAEECALAMGELDSDLAVGGSE
jgi:transketolase